MGNLIKAGFLDALAPGGNRAALFAEARDFPKKPRGRGQEELPHPAGGWEEREDLTGRGARFLPERTGTLERMEWEALSLDIRRHPLAPHRAALLDLGVTPSDRMPGLPHGTRARAAGLLECLQRPPTRSGHPVYFLLLEDERGLLQATIFRTVYERRGHMLHQGGAFLLDGRVEQDRWRGFSYLVEDIRDLSRALARVDRLPEPRTASGSGAFLRAGRRGRRAG